MSSPISHQFTYRIIGLLSLGLIIAVAGFLYSESRYSHNNMDASSVNAQSVEAVNDALSATASQNAQPTAEAVNQPDKSLPVPAHQLKKIISESVTTDQVLNDKMAAANKTIQSLDAQLSNTAENTTQSVLSQSEPTSTDDAKMTDRIQHIRDHLGKPPSAN